MKFISIAEHEQHLEQVKKLFKIYYCFQLNFVTSHDLILYFSLDKLN